MDIGVLSHDMNSKKARQKTLGALHLRHSYTEV